MNVRNKINLLIVTLVAISSFFYSGDALSSNSEFGKSIKRETKIRSISLNSKLSIDVYVPNGFNNSSQKYSTMYVMDGEHYFTNAIAFQKSLRNNVNASPEFIVVGLNTEKLDEVPRGRYDLFGTNTDDTIELLENTIIPYVDNNFPTNKTRMFFGWQFAAGFGLDLFAKRPNLFEAYFLASSPTFTQNRIKRTAELLNQRKNLNNYFYLSLGTTEKHATNNHKKLEELFKRSGNSNIKVHYNLSNLYNHQTTPLDSFSNGLLWYFSDYPDITFYSVKEIKEFGGIAAVKKYYEQRGKRYQIDTTIGEQARFSMFRHAVQEGNWAFYQKIEKETGEYMPDKTSSENWYHFWGDFYLKHESYIRAEKLYSQAVKVYPESHNLWSILGNIAEKQDQLDLALRHYTNALIHVDNKHDQHAVYKSQIKQLKELLSN